MKIKIKLLNEDRYKNADTFDEGIDRWVSKGWRLVDVVQDFKNPSDDAVAILWKPVNKRRRNKTWKIDTGII